MIKQYKQFLLSIGYIIAEESNSLLVLFNKENRLVISITNYTKNRNVCIICKESTNDTRFNGVISNVIQLKSILGMIKELI